MTVSNSKTRTSKESLHDVENSQGGKVMTVSNSKSEPMGLDEAVRMFKGYVLSENGFDELDFKEWLIERKEHEIAEAIKVELTMARDMENPREWLSTRLAQLDNK